MAFGKTRGRDAKSTAPGSNALRLFEKRRDSIGFPWVRCDRSLVIAALDAATSAGAAIMFGSTQGGRGVVVTVFHQNEKAKDYAGTEDEFSELMSEVIAGLQGSAQDYFAAYGLEMPEWVTEDKADA